MLTGGARTGEPWRLGHRPLLDVVRGLAIALVLAGHLDVPGFRRAGGSAGVTLFFVLSGFLITALLLREVSQRRSIGVAAFYWRRAVRLLPALVVMVVVVTLLDATGPWDIAGPLDGLPVLLYVANWAMVPQINSSALQHTWSLSVEEQFYILWPLVLAAAWKLGGRRGIALGAAVAAAASVTLCFLLWDGGEGLRRVYYGSDTRAAGILVGAATAALVSAGRAGVVGAGPLAGAALVMCVLPTLPWPPGTEALWVPVLSVPVAAVLVLGAAHGTRTPGTSLQPLIWLGRRAYGVYLWHYPVMRVCEEAGLGGAGTGLVTVMASLALADCSWRLLEEPFLRLKDKGSAWPVLRLGPVYAHGHAARGPDRPSRQLVRPPLG